jgi:hypothetical protein
MEILFLEINALKKTIGNQFFKATFIKKDGTLRDMIARLGVKKHLKGGEKSYNSEDFNYLTVFDMQKRQYRTINLNTLVKIKINGVTYER